MADAMEIDEVAGDENSNSKHVSFSFCLVVVCKDFTKCHFNNNGVRNFHLFH